MGTCEKTTTAAALFGKTRRAILALLFRNTNEEYYVREIIRFVDTGKGAVERELRNLAASGIITRKKHGNQVYYKADPDCPVYPEIRSLIIKTVGVADFLKTALTPLSERIKLAFIYGSLASGAESNSSDIDLMVIGDVETIDVIRALDGASETLNREINPSVYSIKEFSRKLKTGQPFVTRVVKGSKIMLIGNKNDIKKMGR